MSIIHSLANCSYNWTDSEAMLNCTDGLEFLSEQDIQDCCVSLEYPIRILAAVWCITVAVVGFLGNIITLLAVPWATGNKLPGFTTQQQKYTNIFIVNLALSDLFYCMFQLPMYSFQYIVGYWPKGHYLCKVNACLRYVNAFAAWMAVGFVALSRCMALLKPAWCEKILKGKRGYLVSLLPWLYAILMVIPTYLDLYGTFGYARKIGKCDYMSYNGRNPSIFFYSTGFLLPLLIMTVSYFFIWRKSVRSSSYLKQLSYKNKIQLDNRDMKLTRMIFFVVVLYMAFVGPIAGMNIFDSTNSYPVGQLICFLIYWIQYSFNFLAYAFRNEQFRRAYENFLRYVLYKCCRKKTVSPPMNTIFFINTPIQREERLRLDGQTCCENERMDFRLGYNMSIEMDKSVLSYEGTIEVSGKRSPAIIILPGKVNSTQFTAKGDGTNLDEKTSKDLYIEMTNSRLLRRKKKKNVHFMTDCNYSNFGYHTDGDTESEDAGKRSNLRRMSF